MRHHDESMVLAGGFSSGGWCGRERRDVGVVKSSYRLFARRAELPAGKYMIERGDLSSSVCDPWRKGTPTAFVATMRGWTRPQPVQRWVQRGRSRTGCRACGKSARGGSSLVGDRRLSRLCRGSKRTR